MYFLPVLLLLGIVHSLSVSIIGVASNATGPQLSPVSTKCYATLSNGKDGEEICPRGFTRCITMKGTTLMADGTIDITWKSCWPDKASMKCDSTTFLAVTEEAGKVNWETKMALWSEPTCCTGDLCNKDLSAPIVGHASTTDAPQLNNAKDPQSSSVSRKCYGTEGVGEEETDCPSGITRCITMRGTKPVVRGTTYLTYKSCWPEEASMKCDSATLLAAMERAGKLDWESKSASWNEPTCCSGDLCNDSSGPYDVWVAVGIVGIVLYIIIKVAECFRKKEPAMAYRRFA
ncbi:hypothetical protein AAVH_01236 [Aphelenchoides avenae]|nr:hypothetical protein AAVH_01236 [Aphelenchus avenae]